MSRPYVTLSIPEPCTERWENMQIQGNSRFCDACRRNLVDYSKLTDADLINLLLKQDGKICGRFHPNQLNRTLFTENTSHKAKAGYILSGIMALSLLLPFHTAAQTETSVIPEFYAELRTDDNPEKTNRCQISNHNPPVIKGRLTDAETGEPILFASIRIEGTMNGSTSDVDGYFKILIPEEADTFIRYTLIISSIGYETKRITVDKANLDQNIQLHLKLEDATPMLGIIIIEKKTLRKQNNIASKNKKEE